MKGLTQGPHQDGSTLNLTPQAPCPGWAMGGKETPWACGLCVSGWRWGVLSSQTPCTVSEARMWHLWLKKSRNCHHRRTLGPLIVHLGADLWQQSPLLKNDSTWVVSGVSDSLTLRRPLHNWGHVARLHVGTRQRVAHAIFTCGLLEQLLD